MAALDGLASSLEGIFVKSAPKLPEGGKKVLVEWLPWINLVAGGLTLWSVDALSNWAHVANNLINNLNALGQAYGVDIPSVDRLNATVWIGLIVLAIEGVIFLLAFPATRARSKRGWDLMFYALLINLVYGIVVIFSDYGGVGNFIGYLIGSVIGLWLLFQIRSKYLGKGSAPTAPSA